MGPCGIACGTCDIGNGTLAETAAKLRGFIEYYEVPTWAKAIPGGDGIEFDALIRALEWMKGNLLCVGCEEGGGPPKCPIRECASKRGYELCSQCPDLDPCDKFNWLGDPESLKERLRRGRGKTKRELIEEALSRKT